MSKLRYPLLYLVCIAIFQILQIFTNAGAQTVPNAVEIDLTAGSTALVTGKHMQTGVRNFSFEREIAGIGGIAETISDVRFIDPSAESVGYKRLMAGEYLADGDVAAWSYKKDISPMKDHRSAAHVSWMSKDSGLILLRDLLPSLPKESHRVTLKLPPGWEAATIEHKVGPNTFEIGDAENAVFQIGKIRQIDGVGFSANISGDWLFADSDIVEQTNEIISEYANVFAKPAGPFNVNIIRFPQRVPHGTWQAETVGRTVTIVSADMPFKSQSPQRLHEQLRHELFHLWLPNGVNLSGNYDWFYEGFALYQSLKTGVAVNRIGFGDLLDTLSRAANADAFSGVQRRSLIDVSKDRSGDANTQVYARGMIVAFLCDVEIMRNSKGKRSITEVFRSLLRHHDPATPHEDGNVAVLRMLTSEKGLSPIIDKWIKGTEKLDLTAAMDALGLRNSAEPMRTALEIVDKPNGRQKDLLDKLGYNNWRKVLRNNK